MSIHTIQETNNQLWTCKACLPPRKFAHKKTLAKHTRSCHSNAHFSCAHCQREFNRKDLKNRHEIEKHTGLAKYVECIPCDKWILHRALDDHCRSKRHLHRESEIDEAFCLDLRLNKARCPDHQLQTEDLIDPFLLTARLFYEANPFGSGPDTWIRVSRPFSAPIEVRRLMGLAMRVLRKRILDHASFERPALVWSIAILAAVSAMIDGWQATQAHRQVLEHLTASSQIYDWAGWLTKSKWPGFVAKNTMACRVVHGCVFQASRFLIKNGETVDHDQLARDLVSCSAFRFKHRPFEVLCGAAPNLWRTERGKIFALRESETEDEPSWIVSMERYQEIIPA